MPKYTKQQLEAQYEKLPDVLKDAIFSVEIAEHMFELGKKHGLTMEKTGFAAEETGFVILGFLPPREFASSLASRLEIDTEKATALASDINHQVFFPLREALKETHHIEVGEAAIRSETALPRRTSGTLISEITRGVTSPPSPLPAKQNPVDTASAGTTAPALKPIDKPQMSAPNPRPPAPQTPRPFIPPAVAPKKPAVIALAPLTPAIPIQNQSQEPRNTEKETAAPMRSEPPKSPVAPPIDPVPPPPQKPIPEKPQETQRSAESRKPPPIVLRQKISADLQKEIAPLIGGISPLPGFITREQVKKLVAEKLAERPVKIPNQELAIKNNASPLTPIRAPIPSNPSETAGTPAPIILEPLVKNPSEPSPAINPPLGTAKVPALDLRNTSKPPIGEIYDGFDPYKEPIE